MECGIRGEITDLYPSEDKEIGRHQCEWVCWSCSSTDASVQHVSDGRLCREEEHQIRQVGFAHISIKLTQPIIE